VILVLGSAVGQTTTNEPAGWVGIVLVALPLLVFLPLMFFLVRYQFRIMKSIENAMTRIADAIEAIAAQR
jgi:hypothetical protein